MHHQPSLLGAEVATDLGRDLPDDELVRRVLSGDPRWFEVFVRRYNARLFRVGRAIMKDDDLAEDVMQETYLHAFRSLRQFEGRSSLATWLTRIAVNEAIARRRRLLREERVDDVDWETKGEASCSGHDPETVAHRGEILAVLATLVDALPENLRLVFVLREVEGMTGAEVAQALEISEDNVKVRLFRARAELRAKLHEAFDDVASELFGFHLVRCDRVVFGVLRGLAGGGAAMGPDGMRDVVARPEVQA